MKKPSLAILLGQSAPEDDQDESDAPSKDDHQEAMRGVAQDLIRAVASKDAGQVAECLQMAFELHGCAPEDDKDSDDDY